MKILSSGLIKSIVLLAITAACLIGSFFYLRQLNPWFLFDFIEYWSAGSLLLAGQNPYDPAAMLATQQSIGWEPETALMMWNPPWTMSLIMPLALLDYSSSRTIWFFIQIFVISFCAILLWRTYAGARQPGRLITIAAGTLTGAVFWMLFYGQISFLILLGATAFLVLIRRQTFKADIVAGVTTVLIAVKPQSFYLFWPVLIIWILSSHRWGVLWGMLFGLGASVLAGTAFYPGLITAYITLLQTMPPVAWYTPTIGFWLRTWFGFEHFWIQFLPILPALAWAIVYAWHKRQAWHWEEEMPLLILVSLATSAYTWTHDQVIFLIPFMYLAVGLQQAGRRWPIIIFGMIWIGLNLSLFVGHFYFQEHYFAWLAPLFLIIFLIARRYSSYPSQEVNHEIPLL